MAFLSMVSRPIQIILHGVYTRFVRLGPARQFALLTGLALSGAGLAMAGIDLFFKQRIRYYETGLVPAPRLGEPKLSTQVGVASWYGPGFHGRPTANGEVYNQDAWTAAHRTLPLGTWVRVTNPKNQRSVVLRINDRGPYFGKRVIDLSRRAAHSLDLKEQGIGTVHIEVLKYPDSAFAGMKRASEVG